MNIVALALVLGAALTMAAATMSVHQPPPDFSSLLNSDVEVALPGSAQYNHTVTRVWNTVHHQARPLAIAYPRGAHDV